MAISPTYEHGTVLSKVKLGNQTYYLKDADLRDIVNAFGNATAKDVASSIAENDAGLATGAQVYSFVLEKTADLAGAMHFVAGTRAQQENPKAGDVVIEGVIEYVYDGTEWQELGDEGTWVPKQRTIAGIDLVDNITAAELKTALELKALAYADSASVTVNDYVTGLTGATYTPAGTVTATVGATETAANVSTEDYTPAGTVTGTVVPTGAVGLADDEDGYQVHGTNAASNVTISPNTETVLKSVKTAAVAPSFTEGEFTPASLTKSDKTFATTGVVAAIDEGDSEMLVFSNAATDTASAITAFDGGSKDADTFSAGSAAEFDTQSVMTGVASATAAAQVFTGGKVGATFTGNASGDTINANFSGAVAANLKVTGVKYDKTTVSDLAFDGTEATITPELVKSNKKITVTPDAAE